MLDQYPYFQTKLKNRKKTLKKKSATLKTIDATVVEQDPDVLRYRELLRQYEEE